MICYDVAVQSDGKIVLGGYQGGSGGYGNMLVVRLKSNGTLDNTFGTGGMYTLYLTKNILNATSCSFNRMEKLLQADILIRW